MLISDDHSRVQLKVTKMGQSDYINANYIDVSIRIFVSMLTQNTTDMYMVLTSVWALTLIRFGSLYIERKKEMFYLTTHSTHFIYGYMASDIWLRTILIVRKETRCRQQGFFYMHHPTDRITHTTAFDTPVVEHWLEREIHFT